MATVITLPGVLNFPIYIGATFGLQLTWQTDSSTGPAVDLTGWTADMVVKAGQFEVVELSTGNGRIVIDGPAGTVTLSIDDDTTTTFDPATCDYDLMLTSPGGTVVPLVAGIATIRKGTTV